MIWSHPKHVTVIWTGVSAYSWYCPCLEAGVLEGELEEGAAFGKLKLAALVLRGAPKQPVLKGYLLVEKWPVALQKSLAGKYHSNPSCPGETPLAVLR